MLRKDLLVIARLCSSMLRMVANVVKYSNSNHQRIAPPNTGLQKIQVLSERDVRVKEARCVVAIMSREFLDQTQPTLGAGIRT